MQFTGQSTLRKSIFEPVWLVILCLTLSLTAMIDWVNGRSGYAGQAHWQQSEALEQSRSMFPDIRESEWNALAGTQRWLPDNLTALKIIDRFPNISKANLASLADLNREFYLSKFLQAPADFAGSIVRLSGIAQRIYKVELGAEQADRLGFSEYYLVSINRHEDRQNVVLAVQDVPNSWKLNRIGLAEPIASFACFLMKDTESAEPRAVFAAPRIEWYPVESNIQRGVRPEWLMLAANGFDVGLLDAVRNNSARAFLPEETAVMREFFAAVNQIDDGQPIEPAPPQFDPIETIRNPNQFAGRLSTVTGTVRRITTVSIESTEIRERLGLNQYYQLDVFVPLGNRRLRFVDDNKKEITIQGRFGVTVIVSNVPEALTRQDSKNLAIEVPCFFLKQWRHATIASREISGELTKPNPILFGLGNSLKIKQAAGQSSIAGLAAGFFVAAVLAVVGVVLWTKHNDRRRDKQNDAEFSAERLKELENRIVPPSTDLEKEGN